MSALAKSIDALHFDYKPVAGHLEGCRFYGTDTWEVTRHVWESFSGEKYEETIRLACHECGVVQFRGPSDGLGSFETTHADQVGYAGKPERVLGVWRHPGPRIWHSDERGPARFYVTLSKDRPRQPEDVLGMVGWHLGRPHGYSPSPPRSWRSREEPPCSSGRTASAPAAPAASSLSSGEGGTALLQWTNRLRPGRTRRELAELRREVTLLHTAAWMDVTTAGQGSRTDVDEKVRTMLMLDGWQPDMDLVEQARYFNLDRLGDGGIPGVTGT